MNRKLKDFDVYQRTKDGFFNATSLLKQWNKLNGAKKELKEFFENKGTDEFLEVFKNEEVANGGNSPYLATRGKQGGTWMHPILFIKFAMWLNPRFEYFVIRFVYDELIKYRHDAGDNYRTITRAAQQFDNVDFGKLAKALNYVVFNRHEPGILRQNASQDQLKQLTELQRQLAFAIDMGYIKSFDELINELRRIWNMKHNRF